MIEKVLGNPISSAGLSLIDNVVKQQYIDRISIRFYKGVFGDFIFVGEVEFKNNKGTNLTQSFKGSSLTDVFLKVQNFCLSIEK